MVRYVTYRSAIWISLIGSLFTLSACGGGGGSSAGPNATPLSGNWQFTQFANDGTFQGGLQSGFLLQKNGSVNGASVYAISLPSASSTCNGGTAVISGTVSGQNVTLTAVAGGQTFTLTGALSSDGKTISGTYNSTAGPQVPDPSNPGSMIGCGTAQTGQSWTAVSVPSLTGPIKGSFHSTALQNQNFPVTGYLTQGENIGASNATVTGTLTFVDPATLVNSYPCFDTASVNGQISGNTVILQLVASNGANVGQIGGVPGSGVNAVTFDPTARVLHSSGTPSYAVTSTKTCPLSGGSLLVPADAGNICLAVNGSNACQEPILLTPASVIFPTQSSLLSPVSTPLTQLVGSVATSQTVTLTNNDPSGSTLNGLTLDFSLDTNGAFQGLSDFSGVPNFAEQDTCAPSLGTSFSLLPGQSCSITVSFSPQQSCPWFPFIASGSSSPNFLGAPPSLCPFPITARLTVNSPSSADLDTVFSVPITGFGLSALQPSTPELDFGAEALTQSSAPQDLTFTNQSPNPVQILNYMPCVNPPSPSGFLTLPRPLQMGSPVAGLQVVANGTASTVQIDSDHAGSIIYRCDVDSGSALPNFQISNDTCSGTLLAPQASCSLQVSFVPQPTTLLNNGVDFFLELNTVQCTSSVTADCEIDSGRFPVELKSNPPSQLRMTPAAGLDFGTQPIGNPDFIPVPKTITLFNDPNDPNSAAVNFVGKIVVSGPYIESDNCPFSLAPGSSCTITVTFNPKSAGLNLGSLTINYTPEPTGFPQKIFLRGAANLFQ